MDCDEEIYRRAVGEPPEVQLESRGAGDPEAESILLRWSATTVNHTRGGVALVQWKDRFGRQATVPVRVLLTSGIATATAYWEGACRYPAPADGNHPAVSVHLDHPGANGRESVQVPAILTATAILDGSATVAGAEILWSTHSGAEIGRGTTLDLRKLPFGESPVRATVLDAGAGSGSAEWLVDRRQDGSYHLLRGTIERPKCC